MSMKQDILAGLTVALVSLPQCLAYAMMSGLPPAYGLVTAAIPGLIAALMGHSVQIITGPTNTTGLLILKTLTPFLAVNGLLGPSGLPVLATLTLLAGVLRLVLAWVGGAALLRYIPESVLVGFTAGAGTLIAVMQLDEALGLRPIKGASMVSELEAVAHALGRGELSWAAFALTLATAGALILGKRYLPGRPVALVTVLVTTGCAWALGWGRAMGIPLVRDRSTLAPGWPAFAWPSLEWSVIEPLLAPAVAITILGTLELTVSVRADPGDQKMRREITAQGWANVVGAFVGAFPASASLTRSALLRLGGAESRAAGICAALTLLPILWFFADLVGFIPQAALAGVLWVTAWSMIRRDRIARIWAIARSSRTLLVVTGLATLFLPLEVAIFVGVGLGLLEHLWDSGRARVRYFDVGEDGGLSPMQDPGEARGEALVVEISGNFHYAAVQWFRDEEFGRLPSAPCQMILDLSHTHHERFAAVQMFEGLAEQLAVRGQRLTLCGVSDRLASMLERTKSPVVWVMEDPIPGASMRRALAMTCHVSVLGVGSPDRTQE